MINILFSAIHFDSLKEKGFSVASVAQQEALSSLRFVWRRPQLYPHFNDMSGVSVTPDKEAEMYEVSVSSRQNPKYLPEMQVDGFTVIGLQGFRWEPESL